MSIFTSLIVFVLQLPLRLARSGGLWLALGALSGLIMFGWAIDTAMAIAVK